MENWYMVSLPSEDVALLHSLWTFLYFVFKLSNLTTLTKIESLQTKMKKMRLPRSKFRHPMILKTSSRVSIQCSVWVWSEWTWEYLKFVSVVTCDWSVLGVKIFALMLKLTTYASLFYQIVNAFKYPWDSHHNKQLGVQNLKQEIRKWG